MAISDLEQANRDSIDRRRAEYDAAQIDAKAQKESNDV